MPGLRSKKPARNQIEFRRPTRLAGNSSPACASRFKRIPQNELDLRFGRVVARPCAKPLLEFASLFGSRGPAVGCEPGKFRITYIAEVTHGAPEFHRPRMFVFDEGRESLGAPFKKCCAYVSDQTPSDTLSPMCGSDCQTIDVSAPSVPSADYRSDNFAVDRCDQKQRSLLPQQEGQPFD